jgi:hypothetical protein
MIDRGLFVKCIWEWHVKVLNVRNEYYKNYPFIFWISISLKSAIKVIYCLNWESQRPQDRLPKLALYDLYNLLMKYMMVVLLWILQEECLSLNRSWLHYKSSHCSDDYDVLSGRNLLTRIFTNIDI